MLIMENHGEKQNSLCNACKMYYTDNNEYYCKSCKPLMKRFAEEIKKRYGKSKSN